MNRLQVQYHTPESLADLEARAERMERAWENLTEARQFATRNGKGQWLANAELEYRSAQYSLRTLWAELALSNGSDGEDENA